MHVCERILSKCTSNAASSSSSPLKSALQLGCVAADHSTSVLGVCTTSSPQLHQHKNNNRSDSSSTNTPSPEKQQHALSQMAHAAASMLMSPSKQRPYCVGGSGGASGHSTALPCPGPHAAHAPMSPPPVSSACKAKRPLHYCGAPGAAGTSRVDGSSSHILAALSPNKPFHHQQLQLQQQMGGLMQYSSHAAAAAAEQDRQQLSGGGPCFHAAKRLEVAQGSAGGGGAGKPRQPITPAISQPEPLAAAGAAAAGGVFHAQPHPTATAATAAGVGIGGGSAGGVGSSLLWQQQQQQPTSSDDGGRALTDQFHSPMDILETPPALVPSAAAAAAGVGDAATGTVAATLSSIATPLQHQQHHIGHHNHHSGVANGSRSRDSHSHHGHSHQQQHQQHRMSGLRISPAYDTEISLSWLDPLPDYRPALGAGRLEVIVGPMFAGKSTALLNRLVEVRHVRPEWQFLGVKSSKDTRYGHHWIATHDSRCVRCVAAHSLAEFKAHLGPRWNKLHVIAIDEAQFFPDLVEFCHEAVDIDGKHVIVAGLSGDFKRRRFGQVLDLLPLADSITQLSSTCSVCSGKHGPALFSMRKVAGGPQEVVGGDEAYQATCRHCYIKHGGLGADM